MIVYIIIKTAQNKASIMNSSVGLLLTEEYFRVTGCGGEVGGREDARWRRGEEESRGGKRRGGEEERNRGEEEERWRRGEEERTKGGRE